MLSYRCLLTFETISGSGTGKQVSFRAIPDVSANNSSATEKEIREKRAENEVNESEL